VAGRRLSFALINKCPSIITPLNKEGSIEDISTESNRARYQRVMTLRHGLA
jgi:hypothetical protein